MNFGLRWQSEATTPLSGNMLLLLAAVLLGTFGFCTPAQAKDETASKPNIVIFLTDDQGQLDSSPYGSNLRTPNMQRLADNGLTFTRAFVASPSCAPSRAALLTGLMPARNGAEPNHSKPRADIKKWPAYFKELGYEVVAFGKVSHYKHTADYGFDYFANDTFHDLKGIPAAVEFLKKRSGNNKPLCIFAGSNWPHVPWPEKTEGYDAASLALPAGSIDTPATRQWRARYAAAVTKADDELGAVYDTARTTLGTNTVFVFTSDHGTQWPFGKWNLYDAGIRVPLIVSWPGVVKAKKQTDAMVSWVDLLPTLVEVAGGKAPTDLDGKSFAAVLRGKNSHREHIFATHSGDGRWNIYPSRSVRTEHWKYILNLHPEYAFTTHIDLQGDMTRRSFLASWEAAAKTNAQSAAILKRYHERPAEELYDLKADPGEQRNLAAEPGHAPRVKEMRAKLESWMGEQGDQRKTFNDPRLLADASSYGPNAPSGNAGVRADDTNTQAAASTPTRKPNVLFLSTDDLNLNLGCYGRSDMQTPRIDRLAASGVKFDLAYCQYPLCNPSRVSMLVGVRPDTSKVYDLALNFRSTMPDSVTLPQLYKQNGYFTARVGKIFHYGVPREIGTSGKDDPVSWDKVINPLGRDKIEEEKLKVLTRGTGTTLGFAMAWLEMEGTDDEQTDGKTVTETIKLLEEMAKTGKPFFIGAGFFRPHTPFVATKKWFEMYPKDGVKLPNVPTNDLADIPGTALHIHPQNYGLPENDLRDCVRGYRASVSCLDHQIGQLLDTLERLKLADNTIVVLFSDHGFLLGEHGQWQKQLLFDESARVPLIIYAPGMKGNGKSSPRAVELLDVYPTLKELCALPSPPQDLEGRSLVPLLTNPTAPSDRPIFCQVTRRAGQGPTPNRNIMGYSVRTERWRYTEWGPNGRRVRELYDHQADPEEINNLADKPAQAGVVSEMKEHLAKMRGRNLTTP